MKNNNFTNNENPNKEIINDENHKNNENHSDENHNDNNMFNRTLTVGPSFCGKTHLLLNKLQLIRLCDSEKQIKTITRHPEHYMTTEIEGFSGRKSRR